MAMLTEEERKKSMDCSVRDAFFSSILFYLTSTFFGAFAVALGADNVYIGLLASVPLVLWTLAQIPAARAVDRKGSRKRITMVSLLLSRIMLVPIALIPVLFIQNALLFLIVFVSLSTFFAAFSNPAWASWMADVVPESIRGKFFGRRLREYTLASIYALLFSSVVLSIFQKPDLTGFQIIFTVGVAAGLISVYFIGRMKDPGMPDTAGTGESSLRHFWQNTMMRKFILIFFVWHLGVTMSVPFFVVRLINYMGAGYEWVAFQVITFSISMAAFHSLWGRYLDRFGSRVILSLCALGSAFYPFFWLFARVPMHVIPIEILSGIAWSGVNLAYFNYLLEISPYQKRHFYLALFYIVFGLAGIMGPITGSILASAFESQSFLTFTGLEVVFFFSWIVRLLGAVLFIKFLEEIPIRQKVKTSYVFGELMKYGQKKALTGVYLTRTRGASAFSKVTKRGLAGVRNGVRRISSTGKHIKDRRRRRPRRQVRWA